jgi:nitrile hydratase subunit beta
MSAQFRVGDRVRVGVRFPKGHIRTPFYIRGKTGTVERICGEYRDPEALAYGKDGLPKLPLYRVRFPQAEIWPDYKGRPQDCIDVEIYEHWLERA